MISISCDMSCFVEYRVLECHVLRYTSFKFNTFARLKIDQTSVFNLPVGSSARGYEWNFCYSPTTYHHFSDGWHPYNIVLKGMKVVFFFITLSHLFDCCIFFSSLVRMLYFDCMYCCFIVFCMLYVL